MENISFTDFQKKIYKVIKKIPRGKIMTYQAVAKAVKKPKATRAVGSALNKNPYAPRVPCHRVVKSNGEIGGYESGINKKIKLLTSEGVKIDGSKIMDFNKRLFDYN